MSEVKWIKICTDIFEDEKIKIISTMPDGKSIIIIWFKILCLAGKNNNDGIFMLPDGTPYSLDTLSIMLGDSYNELEKALEIFKKYGMIDITNDIISIPNWCVYQSAERLKLLKEKEKRKQYMREYREKQKKTEKSKKEKQTKKFIKPTLEDVQKYCEEKGYKKFECKSFIDYYDSVGWKRGKTQIKDWKKCVCTWVNRNPIKYKEQVIIERHNDF